MRRSPVIARLGPAPGRHPPRASTARETAPRAGRRRAAAPRRPQRSAPRGDQRGSHPAGWAPRAPAPSQGERLALLPNPHPPPIFALSAYNLPLSSPSANRGPSGSKPSQRSRPVNIRWLSRARRTRSSARSCTSRSTFRDIGPRLTSNDSTAVLYNSESVPQWVATDDDFSWQTRAAVTRGAPGTSALQRDPGIESSPREQPPSVRLQRRCGTTSLREAHEEDPAVRRAIGSPGLHGPQRRSCSVPAHGRLTHPSPAPAETSPPVQGSVQTRPWARRSGLPSRGCDTRSKRPRSAPKATMERRGEGA